MDRDKTLSPYEEEKIILQPYHYILKIPGKQIRTKLAQAFNYWLKISPEKCQAIGEIVQMLHNASLLPVAKQAVLYAVLKGILGTGCMELAVADDLEGGKGKAEEQFLLDKADFDECGGKFAKKTKAINRKEQKIDDIEDNSSLRRGVPVAHNIFGVASTINSANYVYFLGLEKCLELDNPRATAVFTEQILELHRGQGMEIYWRDNYICPTESDYSRMVKRKTGGLFGLAVGLMQLFSENKGNFTKLIGTLGLYFQIRDDYANLMLKEYTDNKSFAEDLTEGKFSFPIIHAIQQHPEDPRIMNIVKKRTTDLEIKKYAVDVLDKLGSFTYTKQVMQKLDAEARKEAEELGGNPYIVQILDELKTW